jgi:diacylglycerol kinase family enzyme
MKPFKLFNMPLIGAALFLKKFSKSQYVHYFKGRNITIIRPEAEVFNIDGEPIEMGKDVNIRILPSSLHIIVPTKDQERMY